MKEINEQKKQDIESRMLDIKAELNNMSYLSDKQLDGEDMSKYGDWQKERRELRKEYNALEAELLEML